MRKIAGKKCPSEVHQTTLPPRLLAGTSGFLGDPVFNNFIARQTLESPTGSTPLAGTSDFIASASAGRILWSRNISVASGTTFQVGESLDATVNAANVRNLAGNIELYDNVGFGAMHTSLLTHIGLPDGYTISSDSGQLVADNGGFAYAAVLAELATESNNVPEPGSIMLFGAAMFGLAASHRKVLYKIHS